MNHPFKVGDLVFVAEDGRVIGYTVREYELSNGEWVARLKAKNRSNPYFKSERVFATKREATLALAGQLREWAAGMIREAEKLEIEG